MLLGFVCAVDTSVYCKLQIYLTLPVFIVEAGCPQILSMSAPPSASHPPDAILAVDCYYLLLDAYKSP